RIEPPPPTSPSEKPTSDPDTRPRTDWRSDGTMRAYPLKVKASGVSRLLTICCTVPRHVDQQSCHAAEASDPGIHQTAADEERNREKPGRNQQAEQRTDKRQATGRDLDLALQLDRLTTIRHHG